MAETNHGASEEGREVQAARIPEGQGPVGYGGLLSLPNTLASPRTGSTLHAKLWEILKDIDRIEKDKHNTNGNYRYASEAAIKERFHPLFAKHGLVLVPTRTSDLTTIPPSGDKKSYITTFVQGFQILDLESGQSIKMEIPASGGDSLDKGVWKGLTGAIKYVLTTLFLIPTGDDPEADGANPKERQRPQAKAQGNQDAQATITDAQVKRFFAICTAKKIDNEHAKKIIKTFGYESSRLIKVKDYESICAKLEAIE